MEQQSNPDQQHPHHPQLHPETNRDKETLLSGAVVRANGGGGGGTSTPPAVASATSTLERRIGSSASSHSRQGSTASSSALSHDAGADIGDCHHGVVVALHRKMVGS
jgi:hypothetical protein